MDRDALPLLLTQLHPRATRALKILLESRHLYQKELIEGAGVEVQKAIEGISSAQNAKPYFLDQLRTAGVKPVQFRVSPNGVPAVVSGTSVYGGGFSSTLLTLTASNIKIYCPNCGGREAAAPISYESTKSLGHQLFLLTFQCQHCQEGSVSFLVKHEGWALSLQGRSPMEVTEIPPGIPKQESKYFRDAVIAYNSGKTLAALFYLRTFLEQFGRRQTGLRTRETGETILETYLDTVPLKHRDSMPSLAKAYSNLSEAIHDAREDAVLFDSVRADIEHHFDIRRVFKIPDGVVQLIATEEKSAGK